MRHAHHTTPRAADLAGGNSGTRVSRRDARDLRKFSADQSGLQSALVDGVSPLALDVPDTAIEGDVPCNGECSGNPDDYFGTYGIPCPDCRGLGTVPDPAQYDVGAPRRKSPLQILDDIRNSPAFRDATKSAAETEAKLETKPRPLSGSGHTPHSYRSTGMGSMRGKL